MDCSAQWISTYQEVGVWRHCNVIVKQLVRVISERITLGHQLQKQQNRGHMIHSRSIQQREQVICSHRKQVHTNVYKKASLHSLVA